MKIVLIIAAISLIISGAGYLIVVQKVDYAALCFSFAALVLYWLEAEKK